MLTENMGYEITEMQKLQKSIQKLRICCICVEIQLDLCASHYPIFDTKGCTKFFWSKYRDKEKCKLRGLAGFFIALYIENSCSN